MTALQTIISDKGGGITVLEYTPAQDQNAFVVRKETADSFKLTKMSDLAAVVAQLKLGVANGLPDQPGLRRGAQGRVRHRHNARRPCSTRAAPRWPTRSPASTIDVGELCSTQPDIIDQRLRRPRRTTSRPSRPTTSRPLVRNDFLAKTDKAAFSKMLNDVSAKMDTATLTDLGKQISVDKKDIAAVVEDSG